MTTQLPLVIVADALGSNGNYYSDIIASLGGQSRVVDEGGSVVALVAELDPALLILDSRIDEPDAYQILNRLKASKGTRQTPILFVSQNLSERKMCLHQDMLRVVNVVSKPLSRSYLVQRVQSYLQQYQLRADISRFVGKDSSSYLFSASEGLLALNQKGQIIFANYASELLLKTNAYALLGSFLQSLFEDPCLEAVPNWNDHPIFKVTSSEQILQVDSSRLWRQDGESIKVKFVAIPILEVSDIGLIFAFKQIKDSRESKDKIAKLSQTCHLTKLPLRASLEEQVNRCILKAGLSGLYFAILYLDLDHFNYINESLGHDLGDSIIQRVAERIAPLVRRDDFIARLEGDEFAVVLSQVDLPENAGSVARKILEQVHKPFLLDGHEVFTGCSIGISVYPTCGDEAKHLLKHAEIALLRAKQCGRNNFQFYTAEMNKVRVELMQLEYELHQAVEQKQWRIQYFPVFSERQQLVVACEIRLSWLHPARGEMLLDAFLPAAEDAGLAPGIFRWLWLQALKPYQELNLKHKETIRLLLPMAPSLLLQEGGMEWVASVVANTGLDPEQIYIELPECSQAVRYNQHNDILNTLCDMGFSLVLDSFGTGYAPLSLLASVPYSLIQLNESSVSHCGSNPKDQALTRGVIDLAHQLGIAVMATSVEAESQYNFLRAHHCDWVSGTFITESLLGHDETRDAMGLFMFPG